MCHSGGMNMIRHRMPNPLLDRVDQLARETGLSRNAAVNLTISLGLKTLDKAGSDSVTEQQKNEARG